MNFCELRDRLLERIRRLTDNGAISESYLARRLGISQPHLHNTLKGVRSVTLQTADQFLDNLGWTAMDLCDPAELQQALRDCRASAGSAGRSKYGPGRSQKDRLLPVHSLGCLRCEPDPFRQIPVPRELLTNVACPELCCVDATLDAGGMAAPCDILLIDRADVGAFKRSTAYVVVKKDCLALRWISRGARRLYCMEAADERRLPIRLRPLGDGERLIARIHAISRQRSGTFQLPAPPSGAS